MLLTSTPASEGDFDAFYEAFYSGNAEPYLRELLRKEWAILTKCPTAISSLVKSTEDSHHEKLVGFLQIVFISDQFMNYATTSKPPFVKAHLTENSFNLLSYDKLAQANAWGNLNAFITESRWRESLSQEEARMVREYILLQQQRLCRGYNFGAIFFEASGTWQIESFQRAGLYIINDYREYYTTHESDLLKQDHSCLLGVTREQAYTQEGSLISRFFTYTPPKFYFKRFEQEMLVWAEQGYSDEELSQHLVVSKEAIKKRWASIYDRVEDAMPGLLPRSSEVRGLERRRFLMRYLWEHPEELRPYATR